MFSYRAIKDRERKLKQQEAELEAARKKHQAEMDKLAKFTKEHNQMMQEELQKLDKERSDLKRQAADATNKKRKKHRNWGRKKSEKNEAKPRTVEIAPEVQLIQLKI